MEIQMLNMYTFIVSYSSKQKCKKMQKYEEKQENPKKEESVK